MLLVMRVLSIVPLNFKVRTGAPVVAHFASMSSLADCVFSPLHPHHWFCYVLFSFLSIFRRSRGPRLCHESCSCSTPLCGR